MRFILGVLCAQLLLLTIRENEAAFNCNRPGSECVQGSCDINNKCSCRRGYTGDLCDLETAKVEDPCPSSFACKKGKCVKDVRGVVSSCHCDNDYYGPACDKPRYTLECFYDRMLIGINPLGFKGHIRYIDKLTSSACDLKLISLIRSQGSKDFDNIPWEGYGIKAVHKADTCNGDAVYTTAQGYDIYTRKVVVQYYDRVYVSLDEIVTLICAVEKGNPVNVIKSVFTAPLEEGFLDKQSVRGIGTHFVFSLHKSDSDAEIGDGDTLKVGALVFLKVKIRDHSPYATLIIESCTGDDGTGMNITSYSFHEGGCPVAPVGQWIMKPNAKEFQLYFKIFRFEETNQLRITCVVRGCLSWDSPSCSLGVSSKCSHVDRRKRDASHPSPDSRTHRIETGHAMTPDNHHGTGIKTPKHITTIPATRRRYHRRQLLKNVETFDKTLPEDFNRVDEDGRRHHLRNDETFDKTSKRFSSLNQVHEKGTVPSGKHHHHHGLLSNQGFPEESETVRTSAPKPSKMTSSNKKVNTTHTYALHNSRKLDTSRMASTKTINSMQTLPHLKEMKTNKITSHKNLHDNHQSGTLNLSSKKRFHNNEPTKTLRITPTSRNTNLQSNQPSNSFKRTLPNRKTNIQNNQPSKILRLNSPNRNTKLQRPTETFRPSSPSKNTNHQNNHPTNPLRPASHSKNTNHQNEQTSKTPRPTSPSRNTDSEEVRISLRRPRDTESAKLTSPQRPGSKAILPDEEARRLEESKKLNSSEVIRLTVVIGDKKKDKDTLPVMVREVAAPNFQACTLSYEFWIVVVGMTAVLVALTATTTSCALKRRKLKNRRRRKNERTVKMALNNMRRMQVISFPWSPSVYN